MILIVPFMNRHNPSNIQGIKISWLGEFKALPNVAVFDTAFHSTIPEKAHIYPIPADYRANDIRKYGFHGTSVKYVSKMAMDILKCKNIIPHSNDSYRLIIAHLGNGASVTAVVDGKVRFKLLFNHAFSIMPLSSYFKLAFYELL